MQYDLDCECGDFVTVNEAAAGTSALCRCGRTVVIPSLRELRRRAGLSQPGVTPEFAVETLLLASKLPEEHHCVLCGVATDATVCCRTVCERAHVKHGGPSRWGYLLGFFTFGWLGALAVLIARSKTPGQEWGKDRIFPLPLRVCSTCRAGLTGPETLKAALKRVPLYRALLERFPQASVSLHEP
jgi:hypothetical protein